MKRLATPIPEAEVRALRVGDEVLLSGRVVLSRDQGHRFMVEQKPEWLRPLLEGAVIYHCGPVVKRHEDGHWSFVSAGPTTSIREEPYQAEVLETYGVRGVIGKGGMGKKTGEGLAKVGACYFHATGGAGALLAERVKRVVDVRMLEEFGSPEAFWVVEVEDFPLVVTMDSHGGSAARGGAGGQPGPRQGPDGARVTTFHLLRQRLLLDLRAILDPIEVQQEARQWFQDGLGLDGAWLAAHGAEAVPSSLERKVQGWLRRRLARASPGP